MSVEGPIDSYLHPHDGILRLSWDDVMQMCRSLAETIQSDFDPDLIIGIAKGGLIPATILASVLRRDLYPLRLSRRRRDIVVMQKPVWAAPMPDEVNGKTVLVVDEISVTGETLREVHREASRKGARRVRTCTLYVHSESFRPSYYALETDALIIQPWDFEILERGKWVIHPEYQEEIDLRNQERDR
jgi:hypoxanthine phosphoribosyltransferase